uniref:Dickkopf N-terminal cysteine-rich domain-containing protein n=1 Tax=Neogobius melanostomus TaxID=47308 RepID=A0A8C6S812_9GOBI
QSVGGSRFRCALARHFQCKIYFEILLNCFFLIFILLKAICEHDRACGRGFTREGQYCRRDAQCVRGLSCMFGKCHRSIPNGQEGARCKVDRDCGASMCCARHHGDCYVPDGGLAFSINQICPCDEGLLCRDNSAPHWRAEFIYQLERPTWTCQIPRS